MNVADWKLPLCIATNLPIDGPLWVNSVDLGSSDEGPLYPRKWRNSGHFLTAAPGQNRTHALQQI
jgi:hypothetical protein